MASYTSGKALASANWGSKNSSVCGMCSSPARYNNLINRQAGCAPNIPPSRSGPAFLLPLPVVLGRPNWRLVKILNPDYALWLSN
jgi:hypothetical protein